MGGRLEDDRVVGSAVFHGGDRRPDPGIAALRAGARRKRGHSAARRPAAIVAPAHRRPLSRGAFGSAAPGGIVPPADRAERRNHAAGRSAALAAATTAVVLRGGAGLFWPGLADSAASRRGERIGSVDRR